MNQELEQNVCFACGAIVPKNDDKIIKGCHYHVSLGCAIERLDSEVLNNQDERQVELVLK